MLRADSILVIANIALLGAKLAAITFSDSLSLIASAVDSALDLLCTLIIYTTSKLVQRRIKALNRRFPVGRRRLEPLGILVFSILMIVSFVQIFQESVKKLLPVRRRASIHLVLFLYCPQTRRVVRFPHSSTLAKSAVCYLKYLLLMSCV